MGHEDALVPEGYPELLRDLKERIRAAQIRAALSVNRELIALYWQIGRAILVRQQEYGWGAQVIDRLSADLRHTFPDMRGFSPRNLQYMRTFANTYPDEPIAQQLAAQLPWGRIMRLLDTVPDPDARAWYAQKAVEHGWSRAILTHQIEASTPYATSPSPSASRRTGSPRRCRAIYAEACLPSKNWRRRWVTPRSDVEEKMLDNIPVTSIADTGKKRRCPCRQPGWRRWARCMCASWRSRSHVAVRC